MKRRWCSEGCGLTVVTVYRDVFVSRFVRDKTGGYVCSVCNKKYRREDLV